YLTDPSRDMPWYLYFFAERADVSANPTAEPEWTPLDMTAIQIEAVGDLRTGLPGKWAGVPTEVSDPNYLEMPALTHPVPPYLHRDLWPLLTHPDVPLSTGMMGFGDGMMQPVAGAGAAGVAGDDSPLLASGPPTGMGGLGGMGGMGMRGGMGGEGGMRP